MRYLFIYGDAGVGKELYNSIIQYDLKDKWQDVYFINDINNGSHTLGQKVYSFEEALAVAKEHDCDFVVAVGEPDLRQKLFAKCTINNVNIVSVYCSEKKQSIDSEIGLGTIVELGSSVGVSSHIGKNCLINKEVRIGHDVRIGSHCSISPRTVIGGCTEIGHKTYIGSGSIIKDRIKIGDNCIIGIGTVVIKDLPDNCVAAGNPARILRKNEGEKVFL